MKKVIIPMFVLLLLATVTSCKSVKKVFVKQESNVTAELVVNAAEEVAAPTNEGMKSISYFSTGKTKMLPVDFGVTKTIADLKVLPDKVEYSCVYYGNNDAATRKAAVEYAISQALKLNGNADVLVEPKHEVKTENGKIISVSVSGYAAYYHNFRTVTPEDLKLLRDGSDKTQVIPQNSPEEKQ